MGVSFDQARHHLDTAVNALFDADPRVRSVGITRHEYAFGYRAVRNSGMPLPLNASVPSIEQVNEVPVMFVDTPGEVEALVMVAEAGPASPPDTSFIPEVTRHRPLVGGLQIQNFDDDVRQNVIGTGFLVVGTLGCFVQLPNGNVALLSNNHVVAGENRGHKGCDRILQPGSGAFLAGDHVAVLTEFVHIFASPQGALPATGNVIFNDVDVGIAELNADIQFRQGYLPVREVNITCATANAQLGDQVFKVGRTTGLTYGEVVDIATVVGPVPYSHGPCWFRRSITIEGSNGMLFSNKGDSGSVVVRTSGEVVGILYAGNGQQTYACPIDDALRSLNCALAC